MRSETSKRFLNMAYPVIGIMLIAVILLAWSIYRSRVHQTEMVAHLSEQTMEGSLSEMQKSLNFLVRDNAFWDETIKFYHTRDQQWADRNIGQYLSDSFGLAGSLLLSERGIEWSWLAEKGLSEPDIEKTLFVRGVWDTLQKNWQSVPPVSESAFIRINNKVYSFHGSLLTPEDGTLIPERSDRIALILLRPVDDTFLQNLSMLKHIEGIRLEVLDRYEDHQHREEPGHWVVEAHYPLRNLDDELVAMLSWYPAYRLEDVYREIRPWILAFIVISGSCFIWYVMRVRQTAFVLDQEISARKEAERLLEKHKATLEETVRSRTEALHRALLNEQSANEEKDRFTARMSHEMRTPLNAISGFTQLMQMELDDPEMLDCLAEIDIAGKRLLGIVDQVLNLSDSDQKYKFSQDHSCDLKQTLLPVLDECSDWLPEQGEALFEYAELPDSVELAMPADVLIEAVAGLIDNTRKYRVADEYHVRVALEVMETEIEIRVLDKGLGVPEEECLKLFQPFSRLHFDLLPDIKGIGLTLFVIRKMMQSYGASINYCGAGIDGSGSCFTLLCPRQEALS